MHSEALAELHFQFRQSFFSQHSSLVLPRSNFLPMVAPALSKTRGSLGTLLNTAPQRKASVAAEIFAQLGLAAGRIAWVHGQAQWGKQQNPQSKA